MDINLDLLDQGAGQVSAEATVVKDDLTPKTGVTVTFRVNGKSAGVCQVGDNGVATKVLKLKVGEMARVTATVVGLSHITTTDEVVPVAKKRRTATTTELIISALFLAVVATASYMTGHASVFFLGLFVAIVAMIVGSRNREEFVGRIQDNDWIFYLMRGITIFAFLMFLAGFWVDGPPELNPIKATWNQLNEAVSTKLEDPWANERWFTGFFNGWGMRTIFFLICMILSVPVSFWDDWKRRAKANSEKDHKGGILRWLVDTFIHEGVGEFLWRLAGRKS